jgi:hypothetical protein
VSTVTPVAPAVGHGNRGLHDLAGGWHDADYNKYAAASNAILFLLPKPGRTTAGVPDGDLNIPGRAAGLDLLDEVMGLTSSEDAAARRLNPLSSSRG